MKKIKLFVATITTFMLVGCGMSPKAHCGIVKIASFSAMNIALNNTLEKDIKTDEEMKQFEDRKDAATSILKDSIIPKLEGKDHEIISLMDLEKLTDSLGAELNFAEKLALQSAINVALEATPLPNENLEEKDRDLAEFLIRTVRCMFEGVLQAFESELYKERSLEKDFDCNWECEPVQLD